MSTHANLTVNGEVLKVKRGETLVDAAMEAGHFLPHDCKTGQCDTCIVDVVSGDIDDCGTRRGKQQVLSCQARITGDAEIAYDVVPGVATISAIVASIIDLTPEIVEMTVDLSKPLTYLPGQYVKLIFKGIPERDYSPTIGIDGDADTLSLRFQIKRYAGGLLSGQIGKSIKAGTKLKIRGPFGHAWLRRGEGPLVLVASGTGWAPIWSIAIAARLGQPDRPMTIIAAASDPANLYMRRSFMWLKARGVQDLTLSCSKPTHAFDVSLGRPTKFIPPLTPDTTVYVAGAEEMVKAVQLIAGNAGAACYADPFSVSRTQTSLTEKIKGLVFKPWGKGKPLMPSAHTSTDG